MKTLKDIFDKLELKSDTLICRSDIDWKKRARTRFPSRVYRLLEVNKIKPDAIFCFNDKPLILFFENPDNKDELHKDIWNFNESPIIIIIENGIVNIFNGFKFLRDNGRLEQIGGEDKLNDFNYFELVTGKTWDKYQKELSYESRVDHQLLSNIQVARELIIRNFSKAVADSEKIKLTNALLGKAIFIRYLIDRKIKISFDGKQCIWKNEDFCSLLDDPLRVRQFFDYLADPDKGFNGNLFSIDDSEYKKIPKTVYPIIKHLLESEIMENGQRSLFDLYDFSIIPVEFISNVYESFIGKENQDKSGVYYTPLFLVDYILSQTVQKQLTEAKNTNCKVLDPSCGSGVFLVESLRKLIEQYLLNNPNIERGSKQFKSDIIKIVEENIFGIDKDASAIQIAIFSVYLTLLDYLDPPVVEKFKFPILLNTNFFCDDFFNENAKYNALFKETPFAFILGNPPWKGCGFDDFGKRYLCNRKKLEKSQNKKYPVAINNNEIVEGFILRVSDFCEDNTQITFVARSTILYNQGYSKQKTELPNNQNKFRQYWLEEFFIDRVFELAPVRFEVFEKSNDPAVAPAAILFYRYANGKSTGNNLIEHITLKSSKFFSLFKIFTINRHDFKTIQQNRLKRYDWLWKVLVYGSYLDFNFIQRLKDTYPSIKQIISDTHKFEVGTGVQYSKNPTYDSSHLIGNDFLESTGLESFFINPDRIRPFDKAELHRLRDENLFKAPMLLIRKGPDLATLTARCALSNQDLLFKDTLSCIKVNSKKNIDIIQNVAAILTSHLCTYYAINTFAFIGIEREQMLNYDKYSLPYVKNMNVVTDVKALTQAKQTYFNEKKKALINDQNIKNIEQSILTALENINKNIYQNLNISKIEECLLEYALNINLPLISTSEDNKEKKQNLFRNIKFKEKLLEEYAGLFIERFKSSFVSVGKKFVVEIWHTEQIIGMFFKIVSELKYKEDIIWIDKQKNTNDLFQKIMLLGVSKITDKLFVMKDVRGFEKDFFYVFKPNERRLWHRAVGYLDIDDFANAMLKSGDNKHE